MRIAIFDFEVFKYDWLVVFKDITTNKYQVIHNDKQLLEDYLEDEDLVLCGFNNKHYDNYIAKAILLGADNEMVKEINDFIVSGNNAWEHPFFRFSKVYFNSFDLMDDMQDGTSLKSIEAHLGMNIVESKIDFNIDHALTRRELEETITYCKNDVDSTHVLLKLRKNYLNTKLNLGRMKNIPDEISLNCTNAKIVAKYLKATKKSWNDGRDYVIPSNLKLEYIPQELLDFFNTIHDKSIPDDKVFKSYIDIMLGTCLCRFAWGGVHGSETKYHDKSTEIRVIENRDVSSLYPSLAIIYKYMSRNCADSSSFIDTYNTRIKAKHDGDEKTSKTLKLPLNTYTGAMEQKFNDLYDPLMPRSIRISGQLFMCELANHLIQDISSFKLINFNTDGLMYSVDRVDLPKVDEICDEWQKRVRLELEVDKIKEVYIKDVNNLFIIMDNGKIKKVGGYLNYGISEKGAWSINNNYICIKKALAEYFENHTSIRETILKNDTLFDFQIIAKAGATYKENAYYVGGERVPIQKVNRCYATNNISYGTIKKRRHDKDTDDKVGNLPEHVLIDNDNHLSIVDIDKEWYITKAEKMLGDFIGNVDTKLKNILNLL